MSELPSFEEVEAEKRKEFNKLSFENQNDALLALFKFGGHAFTAALLLEFIMQSKDGKKENTEEWEKECSEKIFDIIKFANINFREELKRFALALNSNIRDFSPPSEKTH